MTNDASKLRASSGSLRTRIAIPALAAAMVTLGAGAGAGADGRAIALQASAHEASAQKMSALEASVHDVSAHEASASARAYAARSLSVDDTGKLHLLKAFGSVLLEAGYASGTLPGSTKVRMVVGSSVSASFSIGAAGGTIYGSGHAALHSSGRYSSFGGSLVVSRGTGRYAHARGSGRLYGVIDRRTHAVTVQTIGRLTY